MDPNVAPAGPAPGTGSWERPLALAVGALAIAVAAFFVGYAVHDGGGSATANVPGVPGAGQLPAGFPDGNVGGTGGQLPPGFPGGTTGGAGGGRLPGGPAAGTTDGNTTDGTTGTGTGSARVPAGVPPGAGSGN